MKYGWISNSLLKSEVRCLFCRYRNFSFAFSFFRNFRAIASPLNLRSSWQPRYYIVSCCLMRWIAKNILIPIKAFVLENKTDLNLFSPKWIYSLLSINQWYSYENSLFKKFSACLNLCVGRKYKCHLHTNRSQFPIVIGIYHLYIIKRGADQE